PPTLSSILARGTHAEFGRTRPGSPVTSLARSNSRMQPPLPVPVRRGVNVRFWQSSHASHAPWFSCHSRPYSPSPPTPNPTAHSKCGIGSRGGARPGGICGVKNFTSRSKLMPRLAEPVLVMHDPLAQYSALLESHFLQCLSRCLPPPLAVPLQVSVATSTNALSLT